ncbi:hypothetical protein P7C73_g2473, partial [Tremellales sp. Uapishka_1]
MDQHYRPEASSSRQSQSHSSPKSISSTASRLPYVGSRTENGEHARLPRIVTSRVQDSNGNGEGPRSAPALGPLMPPGSDRYTNGPVRSSSSPDPSTSSSPTEYRPHPHADLAPHPKDGNGRVNSSIPTIPPRQSSYTTEQPERPSTSQSTNTVNESSESSTTVQSSRSGGRSGSSAMCGHCNQVVHGQFVRAMQQVFHLNCFRCRDCNRVVAQKFFPVEDVEGIYPLCERDYFARLNLICAKCDQALRTSYITACGEKYHVEHFTCSECSTLFGPNDSYYEHGGKVYCHFHYSTRFAVKCVGCETAILKQFVEMNRNGRNECWHPECYMIHKFWNVKLASKLFSTPGNSATTSVVSLLEMSSPASAATSPSSETILSPEELKDRQVAMEIKVAQIWHVLSAYEESSAACISDMLRAVTARQLLEVILLAERFILHVETLFAVIDDLEAQFAAAGVKGMSHAREAKQLCRKLVNFFSMLSQIPPHDGQPSDTQELLTLVTQLAHYLKILIRIALTGSLKLERELGNQIAMVNSLARLHLLSLDNGDPTLRKRGDVADSKLKPAVSSPGGGNDDDHRDMLELLGRHPQGFTPSTQNIAYGYRSLASEITGETTLRGPQDDSFIPVDHCARCSTSVEEDCVRLGMFIRWHSACVLCASCGDKAGSSGKEEGEDPAVKHARRPPARVNDFVFIAAQIGHQPPQAVFCTKHQVEKCVAGFKAVSRLEQYAFLLHVALRRLYVHFRMHHEIPSALSGHLEESGLLPASRHEPEVKRIKSVTLDRKLSSTARLPQRSTVVESPAGRMADANGQVISARSATAMSELHLPPEIRTEGYEDESPSATVDVIRPPFARNNTSVFIINDNTPPFAPANAADPLTALSIEPEDDALTLGDIPLLADPSRGERATGDSRAMISQLTPLQSLIVKHFALIQLQKTEIGHLVELDEVLELLEVRKNQWWNKIFKGNAKKDHKKRGVFGVPIEILVERTGSDSHLGSSNAQLRVPEFIEDIVSTMRQMGEPLVLDSNGVLTDGDIDMAVEGIFRKNGNIRRLAQISEALDKDSASVNLSEENPVQLAALLKRFLREMPDPLLTFRLHKLFCAAASIKNDEERKRCLHLLVTLLPRYNRDTMEVLFVFLKWVASFSYRDEETGSRMDIPNLATVICPSILYAKGANAARDESFIAIQAVQQLMENQDNFYQIPSDLLFVINENVSAIFAKEVDLPPKEIHKHCFKYVQARNPQRVPGSNSLGQVQVRDRPSDPRLNVYRSDGNLAATADPNAPSPFRPGPQQLPSRPTSWIQGQQSHPGSQSNLHSPSTTQYRGPFQGSANGSRNSSRGSAPSSPGPDAERKSVQMERERSWTPVQNDRDYR